MPALALCALGDDPSAVVDEPVDERDFRAVALALDPEDGRRVGGHEDVALHAGFRGVRGGGASGVAGGGKGDLLLAELLRFGHRGREAARLERAGRIRRLVLDPEVGESRARAQALRAQQGSSSFAERHDVLRLFDRHHLVPAPDRARTPGDGVAVETVAVVAGEERAAARRADVDAPVALERRAAARARQVREAREHAMSLPSPSRETWRARARWDAETRRRCGPKALASGETARKDSTFFRVGKILEFFRKRKR